MSLLAPTPTRKQRARQRLIDEMLLCPDGVSVWVDWEKFVPGTSVFVPTLAIKKAESQMRDISRDKGWAVRSRAVQEAGLVGVRFWRFS